ncbi:PREDICTED: box C/D snoRNA protein 1-like [Priapulus caudatus]|uniref:Box C/D snoRNA protein 1-like n=1 Tax=Priapulus caudatus TaxID=37621 RepID=A0ABM1FC66_PRICU|nr:PREDICTED: box C/D snoRNA protein 1-like [Priapulus caudatus]
MVAKNQCEVCESSTTKYCCPACETRTCSLPCVNAHKELSGCTGRRDRTKYVPTSDMGDLTLLSDYRFLEEVDRTVDNGVRSEQARRRDYTLFMHKMTQKARIRGIDLRLMPSSFSRRRGNATFYHARADAFFWQLELVFPAAGAAAGFTERKLHESTHLSDVLGKYLGTAADMELSGRLRAAYGDRRPADVVVLMAAEGAQRQRYHRLAVSHSLAENLRGKTVVEFPKLYVVLPQCAHEYPDVAGGGPSTHVKEREGEATNPSSKRVKLETNSEGNVDQDVQNLPASVGPHKEQHNCVDDSVKEEGEVSDKDEP